MDVFYKNKMIEAFLNTLNDNTTVGFVPTMGALHKGHLSLIEKAKAENEIVVVSIFVNPTQFDNKEDLIKYPKDLKKDLQFLEDVNCDVVFAPETVEIYPKEIKSESYDFGGLEHEMEGKHRKGHFDGVGTIVKKLLEIVKPNTAYFGEKDFQQLLIVKKLVEKYNLSVKIVGCTIFREDDGLAMSSRNLRLTPIERKIAPQLYATLMSDSSLSQKRQQLNAIGFDVEYLEVMDDRLLAAASLGEIRLIDNIPFELEGVSK